LLDHIKHHMLSDRRANDNFSSGQMREWIKNKKRCREKSVDLSEKIAEAAESLVQCGLLKEVTEAEVCEEAPLRKRARGRRVKWFRKSTWEEVRSSRSADEERARLLVQPESFP
jgi:hypothetical protein